jgi:putative ABC transport system substrate-binding protein
VIPRRRFLLALAGSGIAMASKALAQRAQVRIGVLGAESEQQAQLDVERLRSGLQGLGYDGSRLAFEVRAAGSDYARLPGLARSLAAAPVDVIVASGSKAGIAAKEATSTVPIVVSNMGDAVLAGFSGSLAQHRSNVTGISMMNPEVTAKQLELLREIKPGIARVAVLMNPNNPNYATTLAALTRAAKASGLRLERLDAANPAAIEAAFRAAARAGADAMIVQSETLFAAHAAAIAELAVRNRLPSAGISSYGRAGGLIGYSASSRERWEHVVKYVDRILKGARPADLPIEQPTHFELVVNLRTAKAIGIAIPSSLLLRADEVIP